MREETLVKYLTEAFGVTKSATIVMDERGRSKGYAFVEFQDKVATQKALDAREFKLEGRLALIRQSNR